MAAKKYRHKGELLTTAEIAELEGMPKQEVKAYLVSGHAIDGRGAGRRVMWRGKDWSFAKIGEQLGFSAQLIRARYMRGVPLDGELGAVQAKKIDRKRKDNGRIDEMRETGALALWGFL